MDFNLRHPSDQLVNIMHRIYQGRLTTLSGGNLSIKDDNGDLWITPAAIDKGALTTKDIMRVSPDGSIEGAHRPSSELPFHRAIYAARPDVRAIVHAHAPALVSFSIVRKIPDTNLIPQAKRVCGKVGYAPYALPGSEQLGENIAQTFAQGYDVILLENHGVATVGDTLLEAFQRLETLNFCARTQLYAQGLGDIQTLTDTQIALFDHRDNDLPEFDVERHSSHERHLRQQIVKLVHRACERQLMISTEGVMSARVDDRSFLITPTGQDRGSLEIHNLVLIRDGQRERGKYPSRSVKLHEAIYAQHPDLHCIITAQSPHATAYAVADRSFDTKTIPESYIMLLDVPRLRYGLQFNDFPQAVALISPRNPVLLLQNDCILTTGADPLQAFDRLEVAEFTAQSLIETASIGELVPIGAEAIQDIEDSFSLAKT